MFVGELGFKFVRLHNSKYSLIVQKIYSQKNFIRCFALVLILGRIGSFLSTKRRSQLNEIKITKKNSLNQTEFHHTFVIICATINFTSVLEFIVQISDIFNRKLLFVIERKLRRKITLEYCRWLAPVHFLVNCTRVWPIYRYHLFAAALHTNIECDPG